MPAPITAYRTLGYVGGVKEAVAGTPIAPTTFWKCIRGLVPADQRLTSYRDANTRDITFNLKEGIMAKGSFQTFMYAVEGGALLAWAMGADSVNAGPDPFTHTLSFATSVPWLSVELGYAENQLVDRITDAKIATLVMEGVISKPVLMTADVLGITLVRQVAATAVTFSDAIANGPMNFQQGVITLTGPTDAATLQGQIQKFTIRIQQNLAEIMAIGSIVPIGILETARIVDLTYDVVFSGPSLYQLAYYGGAALNSPSATLGSGNFVITLTSQAAAPGPERSIAITMANVDYHVVTPPAVTPDAKTALYTVTAIPRASGATFPLSAIVKNGQAAAYI